MKKIVILILFAFIAFGSMNAKGVGGKLTGIGIVFGEPYGLTVNHWLSGNNSISAYIGGSYFGSPRLGADYLLHFDVFKSKNFKLFTGPGATVGFGKGKGVYFKEDHKKFYSRSGSEFGLGVRWNVGVNYIFSSYPIEIYYELAPMLGIIPDFGMAFDSALGVRFYIF